MSESRHQSTATGENYFAPALYCREELTFFVKHMGEAPMVACHKGLPRHVSRSAVEDVLGRIYQHEEMEKAHEVSWCGEQKVKECIFEYTEWMDFCAEQTKLGAPKHLSMYDWNSDGQGIRGATGSDGGTVRTKIDEKGNRKRLAIKLGDRLGDISGDGRSTYVPSFAKQTIAPTKIIQDSERHMFECPVCQHTQQYKRENAASRRMAWARMATHCKSAKEESGRHTKLWNAEFSSGKTERVEKMSSGGE